MIRALSPLRAATLGIQATIAGVDAATRSAAGAAETVGSIVTASWGLAVLPIREGAKVLSGEVSMATLTRRSWHADGRTWIEVRGLDSPAGAARGQAVVAALTAQPGVTSARLNRPLSRVVVELDDTGTTLHQLCEVIDAVEQRTAPGDTAPASPVSGPPRLPGDGLLLVSRGMMIGLNAAGLAATVVGRTLRIPAAPAVVDAAAALVNYQPWVRRTLTEWIGPGPTETALLLVSIGARIVTLSPVTLAVDLALQGVKATEGRAAAHAWDRYEPRLARHAAQDDTHRPARPIPAPESSTARYGRRMAWVQLISTGAVGVISRNVTMAARAAVATGPKALRTTTESFAAALGQGLADEHDVLPLRPDGLRRLDTIDTLLIDPRVLSSEQLLVTALRGAADDQLIAAWDKAQALLARTGLTPGWHPVIGVRGAGRGTRFEALIAPARHPLAAAVLAEARAAGVGIAGLDTADLGELRPAFDDLHPAGDDLDAGLADAVHALQADGRVVAVVSSTAGQALCSADVALGLLAADDDVAPPWDADLLMSDLAGVWRVLHALPVAREAAQRGIGISTGASALAGLLIVPGVRGQRGPGPVDLGAAAGLMSGFLAARRVVRAAAPRPAVTQDWHAMSVEQVRAALPEPGDAERTAVDGADEHILWQFAKAVRDELSDPLMPVLALCSAATAMLGSPVDALMVSTVLIGNCMLAAGQQLQAENRLNALLAAQTPPARVVDTTADGGYREIVADRLLPGDVIEIRSNEVVPADARVIEAIDLEVDESSLTGESLSVDKQTAPTPGAELAERRCMLYAGTTVVAGTAIAVVTAVGADTQTRRAAELAAGDPPVVGLQHQLSKLMSQAFPASALGGGLVGLLGLLRGGGLMMALGNAIAVAVAAVPEGMPLMATLAQHASAQRLTKTGALVRVPRAVEALGRIEVVCFDKTGTLSENRLRVTEVHPGTGHTESDVLRAAAHAAPSPHGDAHAHATDQAVIEAAAADSAAAAVRPAPEVFLPFRSGRAYSAAVTGTELSVKGAPEVLLAACGQSAAGLEATVTGLAGRGLRVIAVARRTLSAEQVAALAADPDGIGGLCAEGLTLVGFLGISDTPRAEAPQLLAELAERGIGIRLITGDHPVTATAIAAELGLSVDAAQVITGSQWNAMARRDQEAAVRDRVIFARMSPENKVQIVQTLERTGTVTAMVGDGANDAAAIRAASVGLGVVARGSDSAHATADIVLTDARIGALTGAVDEGRRLWRGVQLAVEGLLGGNLGEVLFGVIGTAIIGTSPLNNRQLLLMNMLTDALPATSVAVSTPAGPVERVGGGGLDRPKLLRAVAVRGAITGTAATGAWALASVTGTPQRAATVALISLVTTELGQSLIDSHAPLVWLTSVGSFAAFAAMVGVPGISQLLGCTPVGPFGWTIGVGSAAAAVLTVAAAPRLLPERWSSAIAAAVPGAGAPAPVQPVAALPAAADADAPLLAVTAG